MFPDHLVGPDYFWNLWCSHPGSVSSPSPTSPWRASSSLEPNTLGTRMSSFKIHHLTARNCHELNYCYFWYISFIFEKDRLLLDIFSFPYLVKFESHSENIKNYHNDRGHSYFLQLSFWKQNLTPNLPKTRPSEGPIFSSSSRNSTSIEASALGVATSS